MLGHGTRVPVLAVLLSVVVATPVFAQACIGVPIADGAFAIEGQFSTTDGAKGYGADVTANLAGPLTLQGGFQIVDLDGVEESATTFGGTVAFEIPKLQFSACPLVGFSYGSWSDQLFGVDVDVTEIVVPIGFGIGKTIAAGSNLGLTLFAVPQFLYISGKIEAAGQEETDSSNEFGADLGFRLGGRSVYAGGGVFFSSVEDSDPTFNVTVGFSFGGR